MFGLGKKKNKKKSKAEILSEEEKVNEAQQTLDEELEKEEKRKKKKKEKSPNWFSLILLSVTIVFGLFFYLYGKISSGGISSLFPPKPEPTPQSLNPNIEKILREENGVIIFEK